MNHSEYFKIVVAEDEPPILNNLVHKLETLNLPIRVVGTAADGAEAKAVIERENPHIVITDIRMPEMDGLELCQWLSQERPQIKTIVLSGYGEFEYAQAAIRYRVASYLLKPVNPTKLHDTLEKACRELEENLRTVRRHHLERQLSGGGAVGELPYQFEQGAFGLCLICLGNLLDQAGESEATRYVSLWQSVALDEFLDEEFLDCWWLIEERNPNERMLLIAGRAPTLVGRLYTRLREHMAGKCAVNLYEAGREVTFSEIWSVARQMRENLRQILIPCTDGLFTLNSTPGRKEVPKTFRQALELSVRDHAPGPFRTALHAALKEFRDKGATQARLEGAVWELLQGIEEKRPGGASTDRRVYKDCCKEIACGVDAAALYTHLEEMLTGAFAAVTAGGIPTERLALSVREYLEKNYRQEITMESLSEQFHFSESYIARLFRTEFGVPPVKYLLRLRIEKAQALILENPDMSFGAIAEAVGYEDQHYFSRLFRLSTGMSPSKYKGSLK